MRGDEGELEAAGEEAEHEQHIGAVPEGFGERVPERLRRVAARKAGRKTGRRRIRRLRRRQRERERQHEQQEAGKHRQRGLPAIGRDQ
jgi:hypothetical protein